jgi:hypothetical protein
MKEKIYKIFMAFSKRESAMNIMGKKGGLSWKVVIEMMANFQIGIASGVSGLICLLSLHKCFDYYFVIPLVMTVVILFFLERTAKRNLWRKIDKELVSYPVNINVTLWFIIGILVFIMSILCALGGLFLLFWSIGIISV